VRFHARPMVYFSGADSADGMRATTPFFLETKQ
jgi:hypothetical protein